MNNNIKILTAVKRLYQCNEEILKESKVSNLFHITMHEEQLELLLMVIYDEYILAKFYKTLHFSYLLILYLF